MKHKDTVRSLRFRYVVGLSAIALLVTTSYFMMQQVISKQRSHSTMVNMAGHQAGLTNRIAYFASLMASTDDEEEYNIARSQVGRTINKMRQTHNILREGNPEKNIPLVTNENLKVIYGDPMVGLDTAIGNFLDQAEKVYQLDINSLSIKSSAYIYLTTYGPHVLEPMLDAAVDEYEFIGKAAILKIERLERIIWIATIIVLCFEIAFIFIPLESKVKNTLKSLEETIAELTQLRKRLLAAQELALVGDWEFDVEQELFTWSDQLYSIFGMAKNNEAVSRETFLKLVHPEDHQLVKHIIEEVSNNKNSVKYEYRVIRPDGTERLVYQYATQKPAACDKRLKLSGTIQDITERKELSVRLEKLSEHVPGFIFQCHRKLQGEYFFSYASKGIVETCGIVPGQLLEDSGQLFDLIAEDDVERVKFDFDECSIDLRPWHSSFKINHPRKGLVWLEGHATPGRMVDESVLWYGYIWDITDRKKSEDRIKKLALYDPLTGLANRRLMYDRLTHGLAVSDRSAQWGALMMLDLDNFKALNDTHGHEAGDALLIEVARRINSCTRESDTISRLGGDEFIVMCEGLGQSSDTAENYALSSGERIRQALSEPYHLNDGEVVHHCSSSVGVVLFQGRKNDESSLLKQADIAMYEAKEKGRNRVCLYSKERLQEIKSKNTLIQALQEAEKNNELALYLQPQIDKQGRISGAEALLRWFPADREPVSPVKFIPLAESSSLIVPIGDWVLQEACNHIRVLLENGVPEDFTVAVNISTHQFKDPFFLQKTKNVIHQSGVAIQHLKFEITESCLVHDFHYVNSILMELNELGLRIELDDFGTGYSSLNSLHNLPIHGLKIDRFLVGELERKSNGEKIINATIAMAKSMAIKIIAEGVESQKQSDYLKAAGADLQQGFFFSKPLSIDKFVEFYRTW